MKPCKDCLTEGVTTNRPAPKPGPRCITHDRVFRKATKARNHAQYVQKTYSIDAALYRAIIEAQGGKCAICQRANGTARRLAVDHDHSCCDGPTSCGKCVRSILCSPCNRMLGHLRDDIGSLQRAIVVIRDRPAQAVINSLD